MDYLLKCNFWDRWEDVDYFRSFNDACLAGSQSFCEFKIMQDDLVCFHKTLQDIALDEQARFQRSQQWVDHAALRSSSSVVFYPQFPPSNNVRFESPLYPPAVDVIFGSKKRKHNWKKLGF